jgi:hypothetical protein
MSGNATRAKAMDRAQVARVGPPLASHMRAGAHSRRLLRSEQKAWLARNWRIVAVTFALGTVGAIAAHALLPAQFAPFLIGAIAASCVWWVYTLMLELGGMASLRSGVTAEEWTAAELLGLHGKGWRTANHVRIEYGDVDHAALGPAGFFAVETKFRSNWAQADLPSIARQAQLGADRLRPRLGPKASARPIVVMWGPNVSEIYPTPFHVDGVTFCRGQLFADYLLGLQVACDKTEIDKAFDRLESIVRSRDSREITDEGDFVRSFSHGVADVLAIATAFLLTTVGLLSPASMAPEGWWTVAACTATVALAHTVRRRAQHPRLRHVSVAIGATAVGLGAMMLIAITYELLA